MGREESTNLETFRTSYSNLAEVVKCEQYVRWRPKERHILHLRKWRHAVWLRLARDTLTPSSYGQLRLVLQGCFHRENYG